MRCWFAVLLLSLISQSASAGSSVGFSYMRDEEDNYSLGLDIIHSRKDWDFFGGVSSSQLAFDLGEEFNAQTIYAGISTNPLRDYYFSLEGSYGLLSDQVKVLEYKAGFGFYLGNLQLQSSVGLREIDLSLTQFFQTNNNEVTDQSLVWSLEAFYSWSRWLFRSYHHQYDYEENLKPFTRQLAYLAGYDLATISQVSSFVNFRTGFGIDYAWSKYMLGLDINHSELKFISGETQNYVVQFGMDLKKNFFMTFSYGLTVSKAEDQDATSSFATVTFLARW